MFSLFSQKTQIIEQGWVKLSKEQWPKWITKDFPCRESERIIFRGKTFDYHVDTKISGNRYGTQGQHNGVEEISKMWRRLRQ